MEDTFKKYGTWWSLSWYRKILMWLHYVPLAYIKATFLVYGAWKSNKEDLSFNEAFDLLVELHTHKLDRYYKLN